MADSLATIIDRPRLQARLVQATQSSTIVIVAPAGFGKSTILRQFVASQHSWLLYVVPDDAEQLLPFVRSLCDRLAAKLPEIRESFDRICERTAACEDPGKALAAWVASNISSLNLNIAIDKFDQCVTDHSVSDFLTEIHKRSSPRVKWAFATRSSSFLPIASWIARNQAALVIDAEELRFDLFEARARAKVGSKTLLDSDLHSILESTEGWPIACDLAIRLSDKIYDMAVLADKTQAIIHQYLIQQVWSKLDIALKDFLSIAAFLPRIDTRSISAAGFVNPDLILSQIEARVGLITNSVGIYELHTFFRDFIRKHLALNGHNQTAQANILAGQVLERLNQPIDALKRYIDGRSATNVGRLLNILNFELLDSGNNDIAENAIRVLNGTKSPCAAAVRAAIEESRGRVSSAETLYARALSSSTLEIPLRVSVAWRYSLLLFQRGRTDAIPMLEELRSRSDLEDRDRAQVLGCLAVLLAFSGDIDRAQRLIFEAIDLTEDADDQLRARTFGRASTVAFFAGDNSEVERFARDAAQIAEEGSLFALSARIKTSLSSLNVSSGRLRQASIYAAQVVHDAEKGGDHELRVRGLREQLALEAEMGGEERLIAIEAELDSASYQGPATFIGPLVARGMRFIWHSRFSDAIELLSESFQTELSRHQHLLRTALLAVAASAEHRASIVRTAVSTYEEAAGLNMGHDPMFVRERTLSLQYVALALLLIGERTQSRSYAKQATKLSPRHCVLDRALSALAARSTVELKEAIRELELRSQGGIARLIESVSSPIFARELGENRRLTESEFVVLKALDAGLSNKAIAQVHGRTVNTVRSQVSAILRKLDSESRGEAVASARRRRLI